MNQRKPTKDEQDFVRVVKIGTALGLGVMAAFLFSIRQIHPSMRMEFDLITLASFVVTAVCTWMFCGVLFKGELLGDDSVLAKRRVTRWIIIFLVVTGLATAGGFIYSLKDVGADNRSEVMQGAGMAVVVLAFGGFLIHKTVRFFEEQDRLNLENKREEDERDGRGE